MIGSNTSREVYRYSVSTEIGCVRGNCFESLEGNYIYHNYTVVRLPPIVGSGKFKMMFWKVGLFWVVIDGECNNEGFWELKVPVWQIRTKFNLFSTIERRFKSTLDATSEIWGHILGPKYESGTRLDTVTPKLRKCPINVYQVWSPEFYLENTPKVPYFRIKGHLVLRVAKPVFY